MSPEVRRRLRAYPAFFVALAVLAVLALAAGIALGHEQARGRREARALERKERELVKLTAVANSSVAAEVEALRTELAQAKVELFGAAAVEEAAGPAGRIEAYADLAAFVQRHRAKAAQAGVILAADERFGFGRFAREGPALEKVPEVWRQRVEVERLLDALWAARPQMLAGVWCGEDAADGASARRSPRVPEAGRCRLAFVGDTACLRRYLLALAGLAWPAIVREVLADPVAVEARRKGEEPRTKFTLALELLRPASPTVGPTTESVAVAKVPPWPDPRAQSAGDAWRFELFGSPAIEYAKDRREWVLAGGTVGPIRRERDDVDLVEVRRAPYRWRLVGHGGDASGTDGWVVLEDTVARRTVRLRRGERDAVGAIALEEWRLVRAAGGEWVAEARLVGRDAVPRLLREGAPTPGTELVAVLRAGATEGRVEGGEGATVQVGASAYRIEAIVEEPAAVEITRLGAPAQRVATHRLELVAH